MIATLLHPCFKTYDFIEGCALIPATDKVLCAGQATHRVGDCVEAAVDTYGYSC